MNCFRHGRFDCSLYWLGGVSGQNQWISERVETWKPLEGVWTMASWLCLGSEPGHRPRLLPSRPWFRLADTHLGVGIPREYLGLVWVGEGRELSGVRERCWGVHDDVT